MIGVIVVDRNVGGVVGRFDAGMLAIQWHMTRIDGIDIVRCVRIVGKRNAIAIVRIELEIVSGHWSLIVNLIEEIEEIIHYPDANASIRDQRGADVWMASDRWYLAPSIGAHLASHTSH